MKFNRKPPQGARLREDLVKYWKTHKTFEKSVEQRPASDNYVFSTDLPVITRLCRTSARCYPASPRRRPPLLDHERQARRAVVWGWDRHCLPAEVFTEQKLGIQDAPRHRYQSLLRGLHQHLAAPIWSKPDSEWEDVIDRIGAGSIFRRLQDDGQGLHGKRLVGPSRSSTRPERSMRARRFCCTARATLRLSPRPR